MRALVIDDSTAMRIIIAGILQEMGIEVVQACDGLEALERLKTDPDVELLLVDWNMPGMNGFDFIRAIRAERAYDSVRILMVTSETERQQVAKAIDAGANEYLMKPFTKDVLIAKLSLLDVYKD